MIFIRLPPCASTGAAPAPPSQGEGSGRAAFLVVLFVESGNRFKGHVFPLVLAHDRSFRDNAHEIREELRTIRYGEG